MTTSAAPTPVAEPAAEPAAAPRASAARPARPAARRGAGRAVGRGLWRRVRPVFFWAHLAAGVAAGLVILVMSFTGVVLGYQRQLTEWSAGANSVRPAAGAARLPLDTVLARAAAAAPAGARPSGVTVRADPAAAVAVSVGPRQTVYVDPYTGAVRQASPGLRKVFAESERWHRSLATGAGLRDRAGARVTGAANLAFLFLLVTGLFLWFPRRWTRRALAAVGLFRRRAAGRQRDWNWHHVLGAWSLLPLGAVVFSAVFISYQWPQRLVERVTGSPPQAEGGPGGGRGEGGARAEGAPRGGRGAGGRGGEARLTAAAPRASLDALWARAAREVPGWQVVQLRLPNAAGPGGGGPGGGRPTATVSSTAAARPDLRTQLTFDPRTGEVTRRQRYEDQDAARRFRSWMRGLHTGEVAGVVGQTIATLVSAAGVVLVYTGLALSFRRLRASLARRRRPAPAAAA